MSERVFITGASGFIGGAIARKLAQSAEVLAMSRSEASDAKLRALGAVPVRCDLAGLTAAHLEGCDALVHCAAWVEPWGKREDYWRANVDGTQRALDAAREAELRSFLHISTEAVLWRGQDLVDVDERAPYPEKTPLLYAETKAEAERRVLAANDPQRFRSFALRPRLVWGPGDTTLVPEAIEMVESGAFAWIDGGRALTSTTHIDNLVHAVELALAKGEGGEAYFVTDGEITQFRDFFTRLLGAHGVAVPDRSVPSWVARPAAAACEFLWRRLGLSSAPPLTRHAVGLLACACTLNDEKARTRLGYAPVTSVGDAFKALEAAV